jgi:hypothetical protein
MGMAGVILLQCMADRAMHCCTFRDEENVWSYCMKKVGTSIIAALNVIGVICLIYYAVPYIMHDTSIPNPDAMLPMYRWEGAGITLLVGTIPLIVANLLAFIFVWKEKIKLPARLLFFLPGIICISLATSYLLYDGSASASDPTLLWLYDKGGINVIWGDPLNAMDTHGGFHGDGSSLHVYHYTDSSMQPEMEESELWKELPLSENVFNLIRNTIGNECAEAIPEVTNGYYFFYDRHSRANDPYDESELWNRHSINCTVAIYDADEDILYVFEEDT